MKEKVNTKVESSRGINILKVLEKNKAKYVKKINK